ncbi:L-rhamnose mutarotase [Cognatishimia sp. WU-CL00825]|uniref:L-rhamnose mutarotase n=1 Tax=Cognatishimia sp. WU-CL00825 TaxID=3127658 RepID=UPI0031032D3D
MEKYTFCMQLKPGRMEEYRQRHDEIWPELVELLKETGIEDYSIHFHPTTNQLFGVLLRTSNHSMAALPEHPVMKAWWVHMADLMECNADKSPVVQDLTQVFYLP